MWKGHALREAFRNHQLHRARRRPGPITEYRIGPLFEDRVPRRNGNFSYLWESTRGHKIRSLPETLQEFMSPRTRHSRSPSCRLRRARDPSWNIQPSRTVLGEVSLGGFVSTRSVCVPIANTRFLAPGTCTIHARQYGLWKPKLRTVLRWSLRMRRWRRSPRRRAAPPTNQDGSSLRRSRERKVKRPGVGLLHGQQRCDHGERAVEHATVAFHLHRHGGLNDGQRGNRDLLHRRREDSLARKTPPPALAQIEISNTSAEVKARGEQWNEKCGRRLRNPIAAIVRACRSSSCRTRRRPRMDALMALRRGRSWTGSSSWMTPTGS